MKDINLLISEHKDHIQKFKSDPIYREEFIKQKEADLQRWWNGLKPFKDERDVPALPVPLTDFYINRLIDLGAISLSKLEDNTWYYGNYRNSKFGKWDGTNEVFHILRYKWGKSLWDECKHFQHDDGFALFVPLRKATESEIASEESKV
jgi:hypothetical protein